MKEKGMFNQYFFYKNRKKLEEMTFLFSIPSSFKERLLAKYQRNNYKRIEGILLLCKILIFSFLYFSLFYFNQITPEVVRGIAIFIFIFIFLFMVLILLSLNESVIENVEKDHYFRILGKTRNNLLKEVFIKRINYAYLNWFIPMTLLPFVYTAFQGTVIFLVGYLLAVIISYYVNVIAIFLTQKLVFIEFRKLIILDTLFFGIILVWNAVVVSLLVGIILYLLNIVISYGNLSDSILLIIGMVAIFVLEIVILRYLKKKAIARSFKYSITSALILNKDNRQKKSIFRYPNRFLKMISSKNNTLENYLVRKDLVSLYRKNKKSYATYLLMGINSLIYSIFIIAAMSEEDFSLTGLVFVEVVFSAAIAGLFISVFYKLKNDTWYSCEGLNTRLYTKFGVDKHVFYKAKKKVNYVLLSPIMLLYALPPLLLIFAVPVEGSIYVVLRVLYLYLLFTIIIDYSIYMDVLLPRKYRYEPTSGLGGLNIGLIIFFFSVGVGFAVMNISKFGDFIGLSLSNFEYVVPLIALLVLIIIKISIKIKSKTFRNNLEGEKIYG